MIAAWRPIGDYGTYTETMTIYDNITSLDLMRRQDLLQPAIDGPARFEVGPANPLQKAAGSFLAHVVPRRDSIEAIRPLVNSGANGVHFATLREHKISGAQAHCHVIKTRFLENEVVLLSGDIACASPELTFHHICNSETFVNALKIGYEICGCYRMAAAPGQQDGFASSTPLTSPELIEQLLRRHPQMRGVNITSRVLRFVIANSASPMETCFVIVLTLPKRLGGYSLPAPLLNHKVLDTANRQIAHQSRAFYLDIFWPDYNLAAEYDSDAHHFADPRMAQRDAERRVAIRRLGIETLPITKMQLQTVGAMDEAAQAIAAAMGIRLRLNDPAYKQRRANLHAELFSEFSWSNQVPCECYLQ